MVKKRKEKEETPPNWTFIITKRRKPVFVSTPEQWPMSIKSIDKEKLDQSILTRQLPLQTQRTHINKNQALAFYHCYKHPSFHVQIKFKKRKGNSQIEEITNLYVLEPSWSREKRQWIGANIRSPAGIVVLIWNNQHKPTKPFSTPKLKIEQIALKSIKDTTKFMGFFLFWGNKVRNLV